MICSLETTIGDDQENNYLKVKVKLEGNVTKEEFDIIKKANNAITEIVNKYKDPKKPKPDKTKQEKKK